MVESVHIKQTNVIDETLGTDICKYNDRRNLACCGEPPTLYR